MKFLEYIFSIKNNELKTHKVVTVLGVRVKFKKIYKKVKLNAKTNNFGIVANSKDIVILGNGPSLKDTFKDVNDCNFIKDKDIFVVNSFMQDENFFKLKPKYLCLMDPVYWAKKFSKKLQEQLSNDFQKLNQVNWNLIVFMPESARKNNIFKSISTQNDYVKFNYINTDSCEMKDKKQLYSMYKQNILMPAVQNVLVGCIYISINIGYKKIFLYGADHSWHLSLVINENNIPCIVDKHFYDKEKITTSTPIYKDATYQTPFKLSELFEAFMIVHKQYEILEDYSKYMGAKIYNLSKFSCIDAFSKKYE